MAEKSDPRNPGGDLGPPQRQSLLELSSGFPDIVPSPGIRFAQMRQSNDAINDIQIHSIRSSAYGISAPW